MLPFILFAAGAGLLDSEVSRQERRAAADISAKLTGENRSVQVEVQPHLAWGHLKSASIIAKDFSLDELPLWTEPERSKAGKMDLLSLKLQNCTLKGLEILELSAEIPNSRFDLQEVLNHGRIRLSQSGQGKGRVRIREEALSAWILKKYSEIKRCKVQVKKDVLWVEGFGEFLIVKSEFTVIAKLKPVNGTAFVLDQAKIYFNWQRADPFAAKALLNLLNPVVDLKADLGLEDAMNVEGISCREGVLEAWGGSKIPQRPKPESSAPAP